MAKRRHGSQNSQELEGYVLNMGCWQRRCVGWVACERLLSPGACAIRAGDVFQMWFEVWIDGKCTRWSDAGGRGTLPAAM